MKYQVGIIFWLGARENNKIMKNQEINIESSAMFFYPDASPQRRRVSLALKWLTLGCITVLFSLSLVGCSSTPPAEQHIGDLVWPPPPEQARIRFVKAYRGQIDVEDKTSRKFQLLGMEDDPLWLRKPYGVTTSADGNQIYVTDTKLHGIAVFDLIEHKAYPFHTDGVGGMETPVEVRSDSKGRLYVTDVGARKLNVYSPQGKTLLSLGQTEGMERPTGLAVDEIRNRIYVSDSMRHRILVYDLQGQFIEMIGERGGQPGYFNYPAQLAVDGEGKLYVVDMGNFRIQIFSPQGKFISTFGEVGDRLDSIVRPKGIGVDSEGHIYIIDAVAHNFRIFDAQGRLLLIVGRFGFHSGRFRLPAGLFIDARDRIYVADSGNGQVQVFQYLSALKSENSDSQQGDSEAP